MSGSDTASCYVSQYLGTVTGQHIKLLQSAPGQLAQNFLLILRLEEGKKENSLVKWRVHSD
jgi:hypothetical protein